MSKTMSTDITKDVQAFFDKLQRTDKGKKELGLYPYTVQFLMRDGKPFYIELKDGQASVREGQSPNAQNPEFVTTIESDTQTLQDVMTGRVGPTQAFLANRWTVDWARAGMGESKWVVNAWVFRLFKMGQDVR